MKKSIECCNRTISSAEFANKVRCISAKYGLRQEDLASVLVGLKERRPLTNLNAARQYISFIENYRVVPNKLRAEALIRGLSQKTGLSIDEIFKYSVKDNAFDKMYKTYMTELGKLFRKSNDVELMMQVMDFTKFLASKRR